MNRGMRLLLLSVSAFLSLLGNTLAFCQESKPDFSSVRTYLSASVDDGSIPGGAVMVLQQGEVVFQTGFDYADIKPFRVELKKRITNCILILQ